MNGFKHQLRIMSQCCTRQDNQNHYCNSNFHDAISWGGEDCLLIWNIKPLPLFLPAVSCSLLIDSVPHCYPDVCSTVLFMSNFTTNLFVWNLQEPTTGSIFGVMLFSKKLPEKKTGAWNKPLWLHTGGTVAQLYTYLDPDLLRDLFPSLEDLLVIATTCSFCCTT